MDTTNFIKSLNSLSDQELYRVKDNIVEQLNIVEALLMSRWNSEEHSAVINDLTHNGKFEVEYPEIEFQVPEAAEVTPEPQKEQRVWTEDQIRKLLETKDSAVENAIVRLFKLQTASEQDSRHTNTHNGVGFNAADSVAGTHFAQWLLGLNHKNQQRYAKKSLTSPQAVTRGQRGGRSGWYRYCGTHNMTPIQRARRIAIKHIGQLVAIANGEL